MFKDKVVLVTGSSRGIGASTIEEFASRGCNVVINYANNEELALKLRNDIINKYQVKVLVIKTDISKEEEVKKMINEIVENFGKIDILVNNASIALDNGFYEKTVEEFKKY